MGDFPLVQLPDPAASRAELEAVLASSSFSRAPALSKILSYVCNKHLDGAGDSVNEWSIAVDALGRRQNFDPEKDSIVRVEFHFLRKRLADYYQKEGASHPVKVTFGDGGYLPRFVSMAPPTQTSVAADPAPQSPEEPVVVDTETALPPVANPEWRRMAIPAGITLAVFLVLVATAVWRAAEKPSAALASAPTATVGPAAATDGSIRIAIGLTGPKYVDSSGHIWSGDIYATGGNTFDRSERPIYRTLDQAMYQRGREGDFRYDIPARTGVYELRLHFAETQFGQTPLEGAEGMRRFDVSLNGRTILDDFDIARDAAASSTAAVKIWKDVEPGRDGFVRLVFTGRTGRPLVNAIELLPATRGEPLPLRLVCGVHPVYDRKGQLWQADGFFLGGRLEDSQSRFAGAEDSALFGSARFGNFNYAIPVAEGATYRATLKFADSSSRAPGERVFDVLSNGAPLLTNFDIFKRAGGPNRATDVTFRGLRPTPQGKLVFHFVPSRDYAALHAIEIQAENK
jgi:hypothetical protein